MQGGQQAKVEAVKGGSVESRGERKAERKEDRGRGEKGRVAGEGDKQGRRQSRQVLG